jgi:predicted metal-binding membrane protein
LAGQGGLVAGFLAVWAGFALLAAGAQVALSRVGLLDDFGAASSAGLQGALLIGAALWQVSPVKTRCQSVCLSPMAFFLGRFRPGLRGGLRMGFEIGLTCLGCCWAIMALGFVGGVMNLAWMGLATVFMVLEKLPGVGHVLRLPAGVVLAGAGLAVLVSAVV